MHKGAIARNAAWVLECGSRVLLRGSKWLDRRLSKARLPHESATKQYPSKLNVGCGFDRRGGYLNVDINPACSPDILVVDGDNSAIPRRYFSEVLALNVLEYVPRPLSLATLLDFADYLADGGTLILRTTSILHAAAKFYDTRSYEDAFNDHHAWTICLFGNQTHGGEFHHTGFTEMTLRAHLIAAGFAIRKLGMKDGWMFEVEATKAADWASLLESSRDHDDRLFLESAYQAAFQRRPDVDGLNYKLAQLGRGVSRKEILKQIFSSPERLFRISGSNPHEIRLTSTAAAVPLLFRYEGDLFGGWEFSDIDLLQRYAQSSAPAVGKITNFLGIKTSTEFVPWAGLLDGMVIHDIPIPHDNIGADAIEYFALLDSIEAAPKTSFTMVEVGASYGPWVCASAVLAMRTGRSAITLVAIEASSFMFDLIQRHLTENGVTSDLVDLTLIKGAVSAEKDTLYFPKVGNAKENGFQTEVVPGDIDYAGRRVEYEIVKAYTLAEVLPNGIVDFLHIDIQGVEASVLAVSMQHLNERVRSLFVAAHSRKIEGELLELLHSNGWELRRERPTRFAYGKERSNIVGWTVKDGGQYWRNPRLVA